MGTKVLKDMMNEIVDLGKTTGFNTQIEPKANADVKWHRLYAIVQRRRTLSDTTVVYIPIHVVHVASEASKYKPEVADFYDLYSCVVALACETTHDGNVTWYADEDLTVNKRNRYDPVGMAYRYFKTALDIPDDPVCLHWERMDVLVSMGRLGLDLNIDRDDVNLELKEGEVR